MAISKLILNGEVQMDVTSDTVAASSLLSGKTATKNDGTKVTGTIASKSSSDLTASGATVTAPAGYYANAASKAVTTTTHPNPTAAITSSTGVVTASHTQGTGYVTGGTTTGTLSLTTQAGKTVTPTESAQTAVASYRWTTGPISVAAISSTYVGTGVAKKSSADLTASGSTVTAPAGYYSTAATKSIGAGSAFPPAVTITKAPTIGVNASGVVTASYTGSSSITPTVTSGYISQGTAGTISTTGTSTYQLTSKAAATYYPSTADQTIASQRWLVGNQTIKSVTTSNLTAENIAEGVVVKVGDSSNASRITQVTGTHSGGIKHTARITNGGVYDDRTDVYCYVSYNGNRYLTLNNEFEFSAGDELICQLGPYNHSNLVYIYVNGEVIFSDSGTSQVMGYTYYYTLPDYDIEIALSNNGLTISITLPQIDITENGAYNVAEYGYANVDVQGGYTIDDIATHNISGVISGDATRIGAYAFAHCSNLNEVNFSLCTWIDSAAFVSCNYLRTASFPICSTINTSAFERCIYLSTISFPACTIIGSFAFYYNYALSSIYFPSATLIGASAFLSCYNLTTANFPVCSKVGANAFIYCTKLRNISFPLCSLIDTYAFANCSSLTTVNFPICSSVSNYAFISCYALSEISFPSVTYIGSSAFAYCSSLTTVSLPRVTEIKSNAFARCINLLSVYLLGSSIVTLAGSSAFSYTPFGSGAYYSGTGIGKIYVPASLYSSYLTAQYWSYYSSRIVSV